MVAAIANWFGPIFADLSWSSCPSVHSLIGRRTTARRSGVAIRTRAFRVEGDAVEVEDDGLEETPDHDNQRVTPLKPRAPLVFAIT